MEAGAVHFNRDRTERRGENPITAARDHTPLQATLIARAPEIGLCRRRNHVPTGKRPELRSSGRFRHPSLAVDRHVPGEHRVVGGSGWVGVTNSH
jgi:hypothetical protein